MASTPVIVTGAARGIGRACALALAEVGRPVAAWDLDADGALATAESCAELGAGAVGIGLDVRDAAARARARAATLDALGSIGGLVHAAGVLGIMPLTMSTEEQWAAVLDVNLTAAAMLTRDLADDLFAAAGSAIVYIASIQSFHGNSVLPAYCASKAGILGLVRSAAHELGARGTRVNCVCPGIVETEMTAGVLTIEGYRESLEARTPLGNRLGTPRDVATAVRYLLSDDASFITGTSLVVDGGLTAIGGV
jgi:NAD(P)-dependent dehydrogenase (short-subunit alcohol dehydrogenase family)